jgi:two-component system chemotaxis response regulator CheY
MGLKILCVDDSKSVHAFLKQCLSDVSQDISSAFDGEQAIELFKSGNPGFQLIFLDWEMPNKTGPETLEELKKLGIFIPVIMLTSKNSAENISQMLNAGVAEYVMKPFTKEILVEKMQAVLG